MAHQKGNALFLILIAVVLFAALSYAITQSDRAGGNVSEEVSTVGSTVLIQHASAVGTGISRLLLRGVDVAEIRTNEPSDDPSDKYNDVASGQVFHPSGGGVSFQKVDLDMIIPGEKGEWIFTRIPDGDAPSVENIGTSAQDMVAIVPYLKKSICSAITKKLSGSDDIPELNLSLADMTNGTSTYSGAGISGQPFMCVETTDNIYVYYHVLLEQ